MTSPIAMIAFRIPGKLLSCPLRVLEEFDLFGHGEMVVVYDLFARTDHLHRRCAGELPDVADEVGLVEIAASERQLRPVGYGSLSSQCAHPLKTQHPTQPL